ncbi:hypothetical protein Shyhy01_15450 [Streptomyces hygroscopicus subsp. hygroscopicus]|uniref:hypothetical protein n=1 Tax=Streptomyces sp. KHY 26 TaxID=3097359 RepID=UPI0024A100BF|nr:hypothetical protein [Streptomyces hygroscopicus]GLX48595.1 hypothetical protein Shyhy01_15450 [Streptomyces hygroscopicus subsp. hygroscopicus]
MRSQHGEASGQGQVHQAGRDQNNHHIETHFHLPVGRLTVLAAGLAAVAIGITVIVWPASGDKAAQRTPGPPASAQAGATAASSAPETPSASASGDEASPSPRADKPVYTGDLRLTNVDLDSDPPSVLSSNTGASFWINYSTVGDTRQDTIYGLGGGSFTVKPTIAAWQGTTRPSRRQCTTLIATQGAENLPVSPGSRYCVKSAKGRIASVTVTAFDEAGGSYAGSVTVWNGAS